MGRAYNYFNYPGKVWFVSDTHFNHDGILTYERTQFKNIEEHNAFVVNAINKRIQPNDTLIHLGDVGSNWEELMERINKTKKRVLILGNHDKDAKKLYRKHFDEVYNGPMFLSKRIVVSHIPIQIGPDMLNVHGHLHCSTLDLPNYKNVCIHMTDYKLFSLDDAQQLVETKLPEADNHFKHEWFWEHYKFTNLDRSDVFYYRDTGKPIPNHLIETLFNDALYLVSLEHENLTLSKKLKDRMEEFTDVIFFSTDSRIDMTLKLLDRFNLTEQNVYVDKTIEYLKFRQMLERKTND